MTNQQWIRSTVRQALEQMTGYDPARSHASILKRDFVCECGKPTTHIVYVKVGWAGLRTEPLPLCEPCHADFWHVESQPVGACIVPSRAQTRYPQRGVMLG